MNITVCPMDRSRVCCCRAVHGSCSPAYHVIACLSLSWFPPTGGSVSDRAGAQCEASTDLIRWRMVCWWCAHLLDACELHTNFAHRQGITTLSCWRVWRAWTHRARTAAVLGLDPRGTISIWPAHW